MTKPIRLAAFAALAALAVAACGGGGGTTTTTFKGTKKVGITTTITGNSASYGRAITRAAQMWEAETNDKGGVNGYKIELSILDNGDDVAKAADNTKQLILQDHVVAMMGGVLSSQCQASMPIAHQNHVPYIAAICNDYRNTTSPDFRIPEYVSVVPNTYMEATAAGIDAGKNTALKKWYILSPDYSFGRAETPAFVASLKKTNPNVQIVTKESEWYIPLASFNFTNVYPKIQAAAPDAIYSNIFAAQQAAFIKGALQTDPGFFTKYKFMTLSSVDDYQGLGDTYPQGIRVYERAPFFAIQGDKIKTFVKNFRARYNNDYPSDWAVMYYDALTVWAAAVTKAGSFDTDKVLGVLTGGSFDTLRGKITIRKEDKQANVPVWVGTTTKDPSYPFVILKDIVNPPGNDLLIPLDKVLKMQNGQCPKNDLNNCP